MRDKRQFRTMLVEEAEKIRRQHNQVMETFRRRHLSPQARAEWEAACEQFQHYQSPIWPYIYRAYAEPVYDDPELLEFALTYVEADVRFFRSGYHKERILVGLRRSPLREQHRRRLREVLIDAVRRRGGREFRRYCRLAPAVADLGLVQDLHRIAAGLDPQAVSRARLMLQYVDRHANVLLPRQSR